MAYRWSYNFSLLREELQAICGQQRVLQLLHGQGRVSQGSYNFPLPREGLKGYLSIEGFIMSFRTVLRSTDLTTSHDQSGVLQKGLPTLHGQCRDLQGCPVLKYKKKTALGIRTVQCSDSLHPRSGFTFPNSIFKCCNPMTEEILFQADDTSDSLFSIT